MKKFWIVPVVLAISLLVFTSKSYADELLMMHNPNCHVCVRFMEEVQPGYDDTSIGRILPLTIFDLTKGKDDPNYDWIQKAVQEKRWYPKIKGTPTFIIWIGDRETGREGARLVGYGTKGEFYQDLTVYFSINKTNIGE